MNIIEANNLHKSYGATKALDGFDLAVPKGRIVGLIGPNGSGKTTALKAILGLNDLDSGSLKVRGLDPTNQRTELMQHVAFIADTGILPKWMKVSDLVDYVAGVHPKFDRAAAEVFLDATEIKRHSKVRALSKGMHVQLHLALILAIDAELLVLDEPTLGLDIIYRQQFYDAVLNDYFTESRSILVTTHEVREIEHILTDVVLITHGRARLQIAMEDLPNRYAKVTTSADTQLDIPVLGRRKSLSGQEHLVALEQLDDNTRTNLSALGDVSVPNLAELFVAIAESENE